VMIKVPATSAGIPAIETLIGDGININATLMFSLQHYDAVAGAYIAGLEQLASRGGNLRRVASVASFFVSRLDTIVDRELEAIGTPEAEALLGKAAIANSKTAYARFQETFRGNRWQALEEQGARVQRPLWASTSTKNPRYPDTMYVDALIGPHTVNTVPPDTLAAFRDHGRVAETLVQGWDEAKASLDRLARLGIDLDAVTQRLQVDGVAAFVQSFESLLASIGEKRHEMLGVR
jgi:transaldolase